MHWNKSDANMSSRPHFALTLAPLLKGYGPTAGIEAKPVPALTLDTRTLARLDSSDTALLELHASQADTTFVVGSASESGSGSGSGSGDSVKSVLLPSPATCIGKTFRFQIRTAPPIPVRIECTDVLVRAVMHSSDGDSNRNGTYVRIGVDAVLGDWIELYALSPACYAARGVSSLGTSDDSIRILP